MNVDFEIFIETHYMFLWWNQKQPSEVFYKKVKQYCKSLTVFTGKRMCWSFFLDLQAWLQKRLQHRRFPVNINKRLICFWWNAHNYIINIISNEKSEFIPKPTFENKKNYNYDPFFKIKMKCKCDPSLTIKNEGKLFYPMKDYYFFLKWRNTKFSKK